MDKALALFGCGGSKESAPARGGRLSLCQRVQAAHAGVNLAGGNGHDNPLNRVDFIVIDLLIPGDAKVVFHSGIATAGHGGGQADDNGRAIIEYRCIANAVVKSAICFVLFWWKH